MLHADVRALKELEVLRVELVDGTFAAGEELVRVVCERRGIRLDVPGEGAREVSFRSEFLLRGSGLIFL